MAVLENSPLGGSSRGSMPAPSRIMAVHENSPLGGSSRGSMPAPSRPAVPISAPAAGIETIAAASRPAAPIPKPVVGIESIAAASTSTTRPGVANDKHQHQHPLPQSQLPPSSGPGGPETPELAPPRLFASRWVPSPRTPCLSAGPHSLLLYKMRVQYLVKPALIGRGPSKTHVALNIPA